MVAKQTSRAQTFRPTSADPTSARPAARTAAGAGRPRRAAPAPAPVPAPLRRAHTDLTRARIQAAAAALLDDGDAAAITFKAVAARAGVTEMTVYRHFPTRDDLLKGLWEHLNRAMAPGIGMPASLADLRAQHHALFAGFDRIPAQIVASLTTPQGREMRAALNAQRVAAFSAIVAERAPGLGAAERRRAAAILQLLHSAYAWLSLREQWGLSGNDAGRATLWAIDTLVADLAARSTTKGRRP
ncbi:MAG: TetR/AcrR family transcriptional regulator [Burkholderiales bacterium]|nr:TetR/AcrR family transcriptional regulator [Burkholderiales bacterium]